MKVVQPLLLTLERVWKGLRRRLRNLYYSKVLDSMGQGCQIAEGVLITGHENVSLGNDVYLNDGVILQSCEGAKITIGNNVVFSYGSKLISGGLRLSEGGVIREEHQAMPITVKSDAWIGASAIILPGVVIGEGAVVAAGSVVTGDVEAGVVVGGAPARILNVFKSDT